MNQRTLTLPEVRREGLKALLERLGPAGTLRFLQQYDPGHGDYTQDRSAWLEGVTVEEIIDGARQARASRNE